MKVRLQLTLGYLFFMYKFSVFWCENVNNTTSLSNFIIMETPIDKNNAQIQTDDDEYICTANAKRIGQVNCSENTNKISEIDDFGSDLLDKLPKEFPVVFQSHVDVNITQEQEYLQEMIDQTNMAEIYHDDNEDDYKNTPFDENSQENIFIQMIAQFSKYLEKSGKLGLKTLAYKVKNLVNPTLYLNRMLKVPKYLAELQKYFGFILQKKMECQIDQQFIILDMLESSIKIFGKESEEICGIIVQEGNMTLSINQVDAIEEAIGLAVFNERKEAFNYLCKKTYACKHFPGYSDYVAKLLKLILKLEEKQFIIIVNIIGDTIKAKTDFLNSIMDEKLALNITLEFESIAENPSDVGSLMTVLIKTIMQRFKVFYMNGVDIRNNTKAVRILIDIIDVTFQVPDENTIGADFKDLTKHIIAWSRGKKRDMEKLLSDFLCDAIHFMTLYWNHEIKEEVKVLLQFIVKGSADNDTLLEQLFTNGSRIGTAEHIIYDDNEESNFIL